MAHDVAALAADAPAASPNGFKKVLLISRVMLGHFWNTPHSEWLPLLRATDPNTVYLAMALACIHCIGQGYLLGGIVLSSVLITTATAPPHISQSMDMYMPMVYVVAILAGSAWAVMRLFVLVASLSPLKSLPANLDRSLLSSTVRSKNIARHALELLVKQQFVWSYQVRLFRHLLYTAAQKNELVLAQLEAATHLDDQNDPTAKRVFPEPGAKPEFEANLDHRLLGE